MKSKAGVHALHELFNLSPSEIKMNFCQLALFGIFTFLLRDQNFASRVTKLCSVFPTTPLHDYDAMSLIDWVTHYASIVYGMCVMQSLSGIQGASTPRRKSYCIVFTIQQIMGLVTLLAHSLIGTDSTAEHALNCCAKYLLLVSNMVTGFVICFPLYGWLALAPIAYAALQEQLSFENIPGILLNNFALISVLASPSSDFPSLFKLSFLLFALMPVAAKFLDPSSDINHTIVTAYLTVIVLLMRVSLRPEVDNKAAQKEA